MKGFAEMYLNMVNGSESSTFLSAAEKTIKLVKILHTRQGSTKTILVFVDRVYAHFSLAL